MEKLLRIIAKKVTHALDKNNELTEEQILQSIFGLQIIIYNVVITVLILFLAYAIKIFVETLFLFIFFGLYRTICGGYHFNSIIKCIYKHNIDNAHWRKMYSNHANKFACMYLVMLFIQYSFFYPSTKGNRSQSFFFKV